MGFNRTSHLIARKEHNCDLCGDLIKIGEKYVRSCGIYDGFYDVKHHENCAAIIDKYCREHDYDDYTYDAIFDWIYDVVCGNYDCGGCPYKSKVMCPEVLRILEVE